MLNISKKKYGKLPYIPASILSEIVEKRKKEVKYEKDGNVKEILDLYVSLNNALLIFSDKEKKREYDLEIKRMRVARKQSDEDQYKAYEKNIVARQEVAQYMYDSGLTLEQIQGQVNLITDYLNGEYINIDQKLRTLDYLRNLEILAERMQSNKNGKSQGRIMIIKKRDR